MPRDTREPKEILVHVINSRVALTSTIYGLSEAELQQEGVAGRWSVKDVMAHLARWEEVCFRELELHLHGESTANDYGNYLEYNDRWEPELQALSLPEVLTLFETAHYRLFRLLAALAPEQWDSYVRTWTQNAVWHHFEEHTAQIAAWRAARDG